MAKDRIYLAGPMSGYPDSNREAFEKAKDHLQRAHRQVLTPWDMDEERLLRKLEQANVALDSPVAKAVFMRADLAFLLTCDEVRVLPGWEGSTGASIEVAFALAQGIPVRSVYATGGSIVWTSDAEWRLLQHIRIMSGLIPTLDPTVRDILDLEV